MNNVLESWQSGNATDSKSVEPAYTGAQVQILYSPYYNGKSKTVIVLLFFWYFLTVSPYYRISYLVLFVEI